MDFLAEIAENIDQEAGRIIRHFGAIPPRAFAPQRRTRIRTEEHVLEVEDERRQRQRTFP